MRTRSNRRQIDESVVGVYHIRSITIRGAMLKGIDRVAICSFDYREPMVLQRIDDLMTVFAVECLDRLVLPTALHMILRNRPDLTAEWSDEMVAGRWLLLHRGRLELRSAVDPEKYDKLMANATALAETRQNLSSISYFMAYLRQPIAAVANQEDGALGYFWEPRFGCKRLPDDPERWTVQQYLPQGRFRLVDSDDP